MTPDEMKKRTKKFALDILRFIATLPRGPVYDIVKPQLGRAGTSVAANYRAACRAKSQADFIAKMSTVEEESDESSFWLEILTEGGFSPAQQTAPLIREANEILSIVVASINTARGTPRSSGRGRG